MAPIASYGLFLLVLATKTGKYIYMHSYNFFSVSEGILCKGSFLRIVEGILGVAGLMIYQPVQNVQSVNWL